MSTSQPKESEGVMAIETLAGYVGHSKEISFLQLSDDRDNSYLNISTRASKREETKQVKLQLFFKGDDVIELEEISKELLTKRLIPCLEKYAKQIDTIKFVLVDDRLPFFINSINAAFVRRARPLKKLIFDSCGSQQQEDESSIFDPKILRQVCQLASEFHVDYEDRELSNPHDLPLFVSVLSQVNSLRVVGFSCTFCEDMMSLVNVLESNSSLKEIVLYNAFSQLTKSALSPLVDALKAHLSLQKFSLLHSKLHSSIYKWAVSSILQNPNIIGFCTDGYYSQNATWLGRLLGTNDRVTEINLSHPQFEDDYDRATTPGAALGLIQGISRNNTLKSVKLVGIPINGEAAAALRSMIENNQTLEVLSCGNNIMMPENLSLVVGGLFANTTMKKLSIQSLDLDPLGAQTVADLLASNITLEALTLSANRRRYSLRRRNRRSPEVDPCQMAKTIANGLKHNSTLKLLSLPSTMHQESCVEHFSRVLESENTTLEHLTFWHKVPCKMKQVQYLTMLNRCGRNRLLQSTVFGSVPNALWANALASKNNADLVRHFVTENPLLFDCRVAKRHAADDIDTKKRARKS